ncbi:MAG: aminomethyl-transferring glycine dehydrogenase subunit GcvPB, partial [Thermoplasmata archaeon]|nr:aminomethyl-transferring glycine dehydrogenase subunit GcvPB [Thermoplasmata archaeon]
MKYHQAVHEVPLLFEGCEKAAPGDKFDASVGGKIPASLVRRDLNLPDLSERDVVKHFVNLS